MKTNFIKLYIMISVTFFSCSSLKTSTKNDNEKIYSNSKEVLNQKKKVTTDFYKILVFASSNKKIFTLSERKICNLSISNFGTKKLYIPKWFNESRNPKGEFYIKIYKIDGDKFEEYEQLRILTQTFVSKRGTENREVLSTFEGNRILFENIQIDRFKKIVDKGDFYAKIYIDLSNFGFFKVLETDFFFKVE